MAEQLQNLTFEQLKTNFGKMVGAGIGEDLFILDIKDTEEALNIFRYPVRVEGYLAVYCEKGELSVEIDLNEFRVTEHTLFVTIPSNILKMNSLNSKDFHFIVAASSENFIHNLNLNFNRLVAEGTMLLFNPCIHLEGRDLDLASRYLDLAIEVSRQENLTNKDAAVSSLASSLFYLFEGIWKDRLTEVRAGNSGQSSRAKLIFSQFMQLLIENHNRERKVAFYSDRLCLTPKYLSKLIRQVSGRTAPEWIDAFVILEAKNMLKYSELTIKEIVYKLNFPNQSVFYKFFKAHTGMTPSEYRRS